MKPTALMYQNVQTLKDYHINQPLVIDVGSYEPAYGIITGFTVNSVGEVILVIDLFNDAQIMLHPSSSKIKTLDEVI